MLVFHSVSDKPLETSAALIASHVAIPSDFSFLLAVLSLAVSFPLRK